MQNTHNTKIYKERRDNVCHRQEKSTNREIRKSSFIFGELAQRVRVIIFLCVFPLIPSINQGSKMPPCSSR